MEIFGNHRISFEAIRRLAIECHALDTAAVQLLIDTTIDNRDLVLAPYEELFSEKLLSLAIALRTKFYQGVPHSTTGRFVSHSGFLLITENEEIKAFTIKDICDKIIHANTVSRPLDDGTAQPITQIRGVRNGIPWALHISTSLFCEGVLNWIASIDLASSPNS